MGLITTLTHLLNTSIQWWTACIVSNYHHAFTNNTQGQDGAQRLQECKSHLNILCILSLTNTDPSSLLGFHRSCEWKHWSCQIPPLAWQPRWCPALTCGIVRRDYLVVKPLIEQGQMWTLQVSFFDQLGLLLLLFITSIFHFVSALAQSISHDF